MTPFTRRRALRTLFCSSAALSLNLNQQAAAQKVPVEALHFLAIGDFGTGGADQRRVAQAMAEFRRAHDLSFEGLLMIGDNFYGPVHPHPNKDGKRSSGEAAPFTADSARWSKDIEEMYSAADFDCPMLAVLGNHDYHDNSGGEKAQLGYAKKDGVRWTLPAKWYRRDFAHNGQSLLTLLCLDSNLREVSGKNRLTGQYSRASLTIEEERRQMEWLRDELARPRAPFTLVMAHHPLYSNGDHGDTAQLIEAWEPLFQEHRVHAYLCGHDHDLQHLELEARFTSHVLSGGGGARTRKLEQDNQRPMPYGNDVHGFTHLSVAADGLTLAHHDTTGKLLHRFTKRADGRVDLG